MKENFEKVEIYIENIEKILKKMFVIDYQAIKDERYLLMVANLIKQRDKKTRNTKLKNIFLKVWLIAKSFFM